MITGRMRPMVKSTQHALRGFIAAGIVALSSHFHCSQEVKAEEDAEKKSAIDPNEWRALKVRSVEKITSNTSRICFEVPSDQYVRIPVAGLITARSLVDGKLIVRPYTPVNDPDDTGNLELIVKGYEQGKLSKTLVNLQPGDSVEVRGPYSKFNYTTNMKKKIVMIAGGSGITPMLQVIKRIILDPADITDIMVVFANASQDDIILQADLLAYQRLCPNVKVHFVVDKAETGFRGSIGYITKELLQSIIPKPSDDTMVLVCGPPPMMEHISGQKESPSKQGELKGVLKELGFTESQVFKY